MPQGMIFQCKIQVLRQIARQNILFRGCQFPLTVILLHHFRNNLLHLRDIRYFTVIFERFVFVSVGGIQLVKNLYDIGLLYWL